MNVTTALSGEGGCPIRDVLDRIGDQWSLLVLAALEPETLRFNVLLRRIGDVSKQMLSRTLRRLEEDGFVERTVYAEVPPRVEYSLTDLGRSFLVPMRALIGWADTHQPQVEAARAAYRARA
ncbi:winged helix-turn-helix transcriptional regulator [Sphingomonas yabuuchiae]|uniref:DNA-binding HxlR family transcriptional regulator n=1 Tax=Sphingomonas yabuuchiae TaxID=172044 RepID=A0AA41DBY2_9SPHN|nr:helix-turn-helix domain-containing protein [Sphingomonas yabuuchiae]MBB4611184.1 DNA-binding HxlR family transcriptional regulator [Sphingomonas yabuuchiae]MBN3557354.1 helix-turn-helix transcriptional regulator [Sphingomonas yabuuchiae]